MNTSIGRMRNSMDSIECIRTRSRRHFAHKAARNLIKKLSASQYTSLSSSCRCESSDLQAQFLQIFLDLSQNPSSDAVRLGTRARIFSPCSTLCCLKAVHGRYSRVRTFRDCIDVTQSFSYFVPQPLITMQHPRVQEYWLFLQPIKCTKSRDLATITMECAP